MMATIEEGEGFLKHIFLLRTRPAGGEYNFPREYRMIYDIFSPGSIRRTAGTPLIGNPAGKTAVSRLF